jgi:hypothetical protein
MKFFSENHSGDVNIHSGRTKIPHPFWPGIHIHIASESLFTSLRNDYSHAPESANSSIGSSLSAHEWSGDYICRDFDTCMNQNSSSPLNTSAQPTRSAATETRATTVLLTNHQTACLDEIAACLRRDTGKYMSRSAMLRAIVAAVLPLYPDWGQGESAADVQQRIATLLRRNIK